MPHLPRPQRTDVPGNNRKPSGKQHVYRGGWQQFSEWFRTNVHVVCQACRENGQLVDITPGGRKGAVDHIIQVNQGGSERDERNLMGLCAECHNRKSAMESRGIEIPYETNPEGDKIPTDEGKRMALQLLTQ